MPKYFQMILIGFFGILFFAFQSSLASDLCKSHEAKKSANFVSIIDALKTAGSFSVECVEREFVDVLLDPYRVQSFAMKLCSEESQCTQFLVKEAARLSGQSENQFLNMRANVLWAEIYKYSALNRMRPPMLEDLPINKKPEQIFLELKEQGQANSSLNDHQKLSLACSMLAAIVGPGKAKAVTVLNQTQKVYKVQTSKEVAKLVEKNRLPESVRKKFFTWTSEVEKKGLEEVRKVGGFHDEPIRSQPGKRSVRLSEGYRLCYEPVTVNGVT